MAFAKQQVSLCLWANQEEKIVSFYEMPGWVYYHYQTKDEMVQDMERFVTDNYRFQ